MCALWHPPLLYPPKSSEHAYPLPDSSLTFSGYDDQFVKIRREGDEEEEEVEEGTGEKGHKEGQKEGEKKKKSKKGLLSSFGGRNEDLGANMMLIMGQGTGTGRSTPIFFPARHANTNVFWPQPDTKIQILFLELLDTCAGT